MVRRVLDSLLESRVVADITLAGPEQHELATDAGLVSLLEQGSVGWRAPEASPSTSA